MLTICDATVVEVVAPPQIAVVAPPADPTLILVPTPGPQGLPGIAGGRIVWHQTTASASWLIPHNLGAYPGVQILTEALVVIEPDVEHPDDSHVAVVFHQPSIGYAILT